jgi:hypothetical protein
MAGEIDNNEEQVADLFGNMIGVIAGDRITELGGLFVELCEDLLFVLPIKADLCCLFGEFQTFEQAGKVHRHVVKDRISGLFDLA